MQKRNAVLPALVVLEGHGITQKNQQADSEHPAPQSVQDPMLA
jgi:hypothetical protein